MLPPGPTFPQPPPAHLVDVSMFWSPSGGIRRMLTSKHPLLLQQGWRHTVLAPGAGRCGPGFIDAGGWPLPGTGGYRLLLRRGPVQAALEGLRPDLIEAADTFMPAWAVVAAAQRLGVPALAFCHSHLPALVARLLGGHRAARWAEHQARRYLLRLYAHFDLVLAPSAWLTDQLRHWGVGHAVHQPLGVDCGVFKPTARSEAWRHRLCASLGIAPRERLILYTGRFAPEKNLQLLSDAVDLLGPGHRLLAVGAGPQPPRGRRTLVLPLERDSRRLARLLASCDAYAHAGAIETFGLGTLEAMACATPVVVSAEGGAGELALGAGLRVAGFDPRDWAEALKASLSGAMALQTAVALERARAHDWPRIVNQMARRYRQLLPAGCSAGITAPSQPATLTPCLPPPTPCCQYP